MNKVSLKGTGKVYSFTLRQLFKNKSNRVTFIIFAVIAVLAIPIACIVLGRDSPPPVSEIMNVYMDNDTGYAINTGDIGDYFAPVSFSEALFGAGEIYENLGQYDVFAAIHNDPVTGGQEITLTTTAASLISDADVEMLSAALFDALSASRLSALGATQGQLDIVMSAYSFETMPASEYDSKEASFAAVYAVQYVYAIILLIVSMFSIIYIVRATVEEKSSKLIELLMVSVKPLALLAGKILAVMTYIFGLLISLVILFMISLSVTGIFLDTAPIADTFAGIGITSSILNLGPVALISVFISLLLAYMTFSILAGLSGTSCSSMDDVEGANTSVTFLILGAYMISIFVSSIGTGPVIVIGSLFPIISTFVAPVQYILGGIGLGTLAASWVIQIVVIAILALFSARVYKSLIMYSGNRVKFKMLLSMYKTQPEKEAN